MIISRQIRLKRGHSVRKCYINVAIPLWLPKSSLWLHVRTRMIAYLCWLCCWVNNRYFFSLTMCSQTSKLLIRPQTTFSMISQLAGCFFATTDDKLGEEEEAFFCNRDRPKVLKLFLRLWIICTCSNKCKCCWWLKKKELWKDSLRSNLLPFSPSSAAASILLPAVREFHSCCYRLQSRRRR